MPPRQKLGSTQSSGPPTTLPEGTPSIASPLDHSWTLQAVMEMQKSIGILGEKVDRLREDVAGLSSKVDATNDKVAGINTKFAWLAGVGSAVVVIATIIWSIANLVPWGRISVAPPAPTSVTQPAATTLEKAPSH